MTDEHLRDACAFWQDSRDQSTYLRAAARVLTGIPHYFSAAWMDEIEQRAAGDEIARRRAAALMDGVARSTPTDAAGWAGRFGLPGAFAGRGLKRRDDVDDQILASLRSGRIAMPVWGLSLDESIARSYGEHWLFVVEGPFHGISATQHSGVKPEEAEVITGGCYAVIDAEHVAAGPTVVRLREIGSLWPADG